MGRYSLRGRVKCKKSRGALVAWLYANNSDALDHSQIQYSTLHDPRRPPQQLLRPAAWKSRSSRLLKHFFLLSITSTTTIDYSSTLKVLSGLLRWLWKLYMSCLGWLLDETILAIGLSALSITPPLDSASPSFLPSIHHCTTNQ